MASTKSLGAERVGCVQRMLRGESVPDVGVLAGGTGQEPREVGQAKVKGSGDELTKQQSQPQHPGKRRSVGIGATVIVVVSILIII